MKKLFTLIALVPMTLIGQQLTPVTELNETINESSGLLFLDGKILTINDSGGSTEIFEIDEVTGEILRVVTITNGFNVDWEGLSVDDEYLYVGDYGNNSGSRKDLKFYRIPMDSYLTSSFVKAEVIDFKYEDQIAFSQTLGQTRYDAEASVCLNDSLYIFTKNWESSWCYIYSVPKTPGNHIATKVDSLEFNGMVTDMAMVGDKELAVIGYDLSGTPFLAEVSYDISTQSKIEFNVETQYELFVPQSYSVQIEGICFTDESKYYVSSEDNFFGVGALYQFEIVIDPTVGIEEKQYSAFEVYPNPASDILHVKNVTGDRIIIFDNTGKAVVDMSVENASYVFNVRDWLRGVYIIALERDGILVETKKFIKK